MQRWIITIEIAALAACSGPPTIPDAAEPSPSVTTTRPIIHGAHGNAIDIVAASADGRAAVTQDAEGNPRLWPTLDGTVEPIVLRIAAAAELALVRDGDDTLVGSLDPAGGLQLVRVTRDGTPRPRIALTVDVRTGALRERRCGWQFGLVTTKLERSGNAVSVCDAE